MPYISCKKTSYTLNTYTNFRKSLSLNLISEDYKFIRIGKATLLMLNGYTYSRNSQTMNYYCSKKSKGCKARVKLDEDGVIRERTYDIVHCHPPPTFRKLSTGEYVRIS